MAVGIGDPITVAKARLDYPLVRRALAGVAARGDDELKKKIRMVHLQYKADLVHLSNELMKQTLSRTVLATIPTGHSETR